MKPVRYPETAHVWRDCSVRRRGLTDPDDPFSPRSWSSWSEQRRAGDPADPPLNSDKPCSRPAARELRAIVAELENRPLPAVRRHNLDTHERGNEGAVLPHDPGNWHREVQIDKPRGREVLVRTAAAGICHSDYHYLTGAYETPLPAVMGHESAGVVEAVGEGSPTFPRVTMS